MNWILIKIFLHKQECEQDSDEDTVIFNNSKTRRYVRKGLCRSMYMCLQTNELFSVPPITGFQNYRKESVITGHLPTAAFRDSCQEYLKSSHYPGPSQSLGTYDGISQEQYGHHILNTLPADRILPMCIQPTKKAMNPIHHDKEERHQGQHRERVQKNRRFDRNEKYIKNKPDSQESNYDRELAALVFRGFDNRYSNQKIQKDLLKHTHLGLSAFLMENETLILKNAWQKEIIPRQKMADELKAPMTVIKPGNFSNQNALDPKALSSQELFMNVCISDSSIDDSLSGIEELGEILKETFVDMNNSIEGNQEENSFRTLTEKSENITCNKESETASALYPSVPFNSSLPKHDKSQFSKSQSEAAFSVPEPGGEILAVEIPDVATENTTDISMHLRCRRYLFGQKCPRGDYCSYLHSFPKTDNVLCKEFLLGKCLRTAAQCWFKHPGEIITEEDETYEEGPSEEYSVGTLLSLLKTQQKTEAASKPSKSQVSASEFIGKLKISKPKPVGTPRRKTSEQDAGSSATGKQVIENDNPRQMPPVSSEVQNCNRNIFKATCSKESLSVKKTAIENSLPKIDAVSNSSVNLNQRIETSVSMNENKFDKGKRVCKENRTMVGLKKVRKENQTQGEMKTASVRNENVEGSDSGVSVNVVAMNDNGIEVKSMHINRPKTHSCADTITRKTESFINMTVNSGEESSIIKNSQGSSTIPERESKDKKTSKHKKKKSKKPYHIDSNDNHGKGKSGIYDKNNTCEFSPREKENKQSNMGIIRAEFKNKKSKYPPIKGSSKDSQDETNRLPKDVDKGKKSLEVTKDQNKEHKGSKSKHMRSEDAHYKSSDPHEKDKNAKRRRTASELLGFENRELVTKAIEPSEDENKSEMRDVQNSLSCNPDNMIRPTESDYSSTVIQTEPENVSESNDNSGHEVVDKSSVQCNTLDMIESEDVMKTETFEFIEISDKSEQHRKKVNILTELTRQWLHDVDGNYISSGDPFDDLCKVIQEMGLEIWNDIKYPDVYIWEVNMRRMFISLYTSLDLETFTKEIHKVMKDVPDIYEFFSVHKSV